MQMFIVVDLLSCVSTSMRNLAIRDDTNASGNESSASSGRWPPCRSYDVIMYDVKAGHETIYVNNFSQNRGRAVIEVSLCLSRPDASTDMQYDIRVSFIRSGHLTWSKVKFSNWSFGVKMRMFRCVLTRGEYDGVSCFSRSFLVQMLFVKKKWFHQKTTFFVWPSMGRSKCDLS